MSYPDCKQCGDSEDVASSDFGLYIMELTGEACNYWCKHCKVFINDDGDVIEIWERDDDDWHDCEIRIPGFDNSDRLIQKELGPLHLRYVHYGEMKKSEMYGQMLNWTGGGRGSKNAQNAYDKREDDIEELADIIVDFIQSRTYFREHGEFEGDGIITVITAPKSCQHGSANCSKNKHKDHLGYKIGLRVSKRIREVVGDVKHLMGWDLYLCDFPSVSGISWKQKAGIKYGSWLDDAVPSHRSRISESDLVVIVDDTMISYMTQLRISMSVRKYNPGAPILCAAVFGLTPWESGRFDTAEKLYPFLKNAVE